jgi:hypothetical protein
MQASGDLVAVIIELASGMQLSENDLKGAHLLTRMHLGRDTTTIVLDPDHIVLLDGNPDRVAKSGHRLIYAIVDNLVHQMVQTFDPRGTDIHSRPLSDCFESL